MGRSWFVNIHVGKYLIRVYIFDVLVIVHVNLGVELRLWSHLYMKMVLDFRLAELTQKIG